MLKLDYKKDEILQMYDNGATMYSIAKNIGEYEQAVANVVKKYRDVPKKRPYKIDEDYFEEINSVDKAYFFGLIAADGSIVNQNSKTTKKSMTISLQKRDGYILELMRQAMKAEVTIKDYKQSYQKEDGNLYVQSRFVTGNSKITNDLMSHGIIPLKSKTLGPLIKEVHSDFIIDFIRGYFDGNGSITQSVTSGTKMRNYVSIRGSEDILTDIKSYLSIHLGITGGAIFFSKGSEEYTGTYTWSFGAKKNIIDFKNAIYHANVKDYYIKRKKEKFLW